TSTRTNRQEFKPCLRSLGYDLPLVEEGGPDPEFEAILDTVDPNRNTEETLEKKPKRKGFFSLFLQVQEIQKPHCLTPARWENGAPIQELSVAELKNPAIYKPFLIGMALMFFQQVSGINAIMFYAETIFEDANFKDSAAASVIVGSIQVCFTALAALIIDRIGRKILLVVSGLIMATSSALVAVYFKMAFPLPTNTSQVGPLTHVLTVAQSAEEHDLAWLALLSLSLFIMGFALGWGPIPWLVMSEIFPLRARGTASGACVLTNWFMAFLVTKEFHDLMSLLTPAGTFWLFAATCLLNVLFTILCVPETRGKTLEEIEAHFRRSR
ncbi:hypothetical protein lerEdw1_011235, partial [Lerista edwardsae]